jgi:hypothetical protein
MCGTIFKISKAALFCLAFALCLGLSQAAVARPALPQSVNAKGSVYVCACMGTESCPCMSMVKNGGRSREFESLRAYHCFHS